MADHKHFANVLPSGQIVSVLHLESFQRPDGTESMIPCPAEVGTGTHYYDAGKQSFVRMPESPGDYARFDYAARTWVIDTQMAAHMARAQRDALLAATDWTQLPDAPEATKAKWQAYRKALRDVTKQPGFPAQPA